MNQLEPRRSIQIYVNPVNILWIHTCPAQIEILLQHYVRSRCSSHAHDTGQRARTVGGRGGSLQLYVHIHPPTSWSVQRVRRPSNPIFHLAATYLRSGPILSAPSIQASRPPESRILLYGGSNLAATGGRHSGPRPSQIDVLPIPSSHLAATYFRSPPILPASRPPDPGLQNVEP